MESCSDMVALILVKCPAVLNPATEDYNIRILLKEKVAGLKTLLGQSHPCRPTYDDQRLIFRGEILKDDLTIAEMCQKEDSTTLVVHMVLKSGKYNYPESLKTTPLTEERTLKDEKVDSTTRVSRASPSPIFPGTLIPPTYYGFVNNQGQLVYADISKAVLFDGRQFYMMRGATLPIGPAVPLTISTATSSSPLSPPSSPSNNRPERPRGRQASFRRINFDFATFFSIIMRFGLVILIFSQGGNTSRVAIICAIFAVILLAQAGIFHVGQGPNIINRLWEVIMRARPRPNHPPQAVPPPPEGDNNNLHPPNGDGDDATPLTQRSPPPPLIQHNNPLVKIIEVFTTFFLSLFPTEPPREGNLAPIR